MSDDELKPKSRGLGRGLNALFEDEESAFPLVDTAEASSGAGEEAIMPGRRRQVLPIEILAPGESQPRHIFDDEALEQLADSIRVHGVLQPIVVREDKSKIGRYEIIAGERRWRAAQRAQLHDVPVIVLELTDIEAMEIALVENLQREDLNIVDEARAYQKLLNDYGHTQEKLGSVLGKSRAHIANTVRLLGLPNPVLDNLEQGVLSAGHARALITAKDPVTLAKDVISKGLSVRQTERLVAKEGISPKKSSKKSVKVVKDADTIAIENDISGSLGMRISINSRKSDHSEGILTVEYKSLDQLQDLIRRLSSCCALLEPEYVLRD